MEGKKEGMKKLMNEGWMDGKEQGRKEGHWRVTQGGSIPKSKLAEAGGEARQSKARWERWGSEGESRR